MNILFSLKALQTAAAIIILMACASFQATAQTAQYVTVFCTNGVNGQLPIQTNQIVSIVGYDWISTPTLLGYLPNGASIYLSPFGPGTASKMSQIPQIITGLTNVTVTAGGTSWATFQITTPAAATIVSNYVPADAIVIPASATGNVQIILESSPDLVNWTAAQPGIYGPSAATNRFFRVRAIAN